MTAKPEPALPALEVGDVVRLSSASQPKMTVRAVDSDTNIVCGWHDQSDAFLSLTFDRRELVLVRRAGE
jgi:uncharacterized protein YodC (DUF2158 family)